MTSKYQSLFSDAIEVWKSTIPCQNTYGVIEKDGYYQLKNKCVCLIGAVAIGKKVDESISKTIANHYSLTITEIESMRRYFDQRHFDDSELCTLVNDLITIVKPQRFPNEKFT